MKVPVIDVLFEAKHLTQKGRFQGISFQVKRGELFGIAGLIGTGKTEMMQAIFWMLRLDEGELKKIKEMEVPVMSQAINAYYTITTSSEFREKERLRAEARHDEAQALYNARKEREYREVKSLIEYKSYTKRVP